MGTLLTGLFAGTLMGVVLGIGAATVYLERISQKNTVVPTAANSTTAGKSSESQFDNNPIVHVSSVSSEASQSNTAIDSSLPAKLQLSDLTSFGRAPEFSHIYTIMQKVASANFTELEALVRRKPTRQFPSRTFRRIHDTDGDISNA